jgi:translation initiation factor 5A
MAITEGEKKFGYAGDLKEGSYALIEGEPCQIKGVEKSKPGKHGAAKIRATGMGIFRDVKKTLLKPVDADVEIPIIEKGDAQVVAIMGDRIQIMDTKDYSINEIEKPKDVPGITSGSEVQYIKWGSLIRVVSKKGETK